MFKKLRFYFPFLIGTILFSCTTADRHVEVGAYTIELDPTIASQFASTIESKTARAPDFVEEFTDDRNSWNLASPETTSITIGNESAIVSMKGDSGEIEFAPERKQNISGDGGFSIEFSVQAVFTGNGGGWSIVLYDRSGLNDHIGFGIWRDSGLRIWKNIDGKHYQLADNIPVSGAFLTDNFSVVKVLSNLEQTAVIINGEPICLLQDDIYSLAGWFGLRVESAKEDATVTFDNLYIWRL